MNRRIFNFLVFCITILTVNLITTFITDYLMRYKNQAEYMKFTAIGMVVVVIVFYPLFEYLNLFTEKITTQLLKKGKNIFGRTIGIYISFIIMLALLYYIYAHIWFDVDLIKQLFNSIF